MTKKKTPLLILILLASLSSFAAILVAPAIPALAITFHISKSNMEWAFSLYLVGCAIGQLSWGPISEKEGRKRTAQLGIVLGLFAAVLCVAADHYQNASLFMFARLLMGMGFSSGLVMSMAMIADTHSKTESRQTFSIIVLFFALIPAIAMVCGGVLIKQLNYQYISYLIAFIGTVAFISVSLLQETSSQQQVTTYSIKVIAHHYLLLIKNIHYILFIIVYALMASMIYVFNGVSPFIGINLEHINPQSFSFMSVFPSAGILLGGFLSNRLAHIFSAKHLIMTGIAVSILASGVMGGFFMFNNLSLLPLFICAFFLFIGMALVIPNASMSAIYAANSSALAAGCMNATGLFAASVLTYQVGLYIFKWPLILPLSLLMIGVASLLLQFILNTRASHT